MKNFATVGLVVGVLLLAGGGAYVAYVKLKSKVQEGTEKAVSTAAPAAGYQAGRGAVDALFDNVQTLLERMGAQQRVTEGNI